MEITTVIKITTWISCLTCNVNYECLHALSHISNMCCLCTVTFFLGASSSSWSCLFTSWPNYLLLIIITPFLRSLTLTLIQLRRLLVLSVTYSHIWCWRFKYCTYFIISFIFGRVVYSSGSRRPTILRAMYFACITSGKIVRPLGFIHFS